MFFKQLYERFSTRASVVFLQNGGDQRAGKYWTTFSMTAFGDA